MGAPADSWLLLSSVLVDDAVSELPSREECLDSESVGAEGGLSRGRFLCPAAGVLLGVSSATAASVFSASAVAAFAGVCFARKA